METPQKGKRKRRKTKGELLWAVVLVVVISAKQSRRAMEWELFWLIVPIWMERAPNLKLYFSPSGKDSLLLAFEITLHKEKRA